MVRSSGPSGSSSQGAVCRHVGCLAVRGSFSQAILVGQAEQVVAMNFPAGSIVAWYSSSESRGTAMPSRRGQPESICCRIWPVNDQ